jgi:hypothetical protein
MDIYKHVAKGQDSTLTTNSHVAKEDAVKRNVDIATDND